MFVIIIKKFNIIAFVQEYKNFITLKCKLVSIKIYYSHLMNWYKKDNKSLFIEFDRAERHDILFCYSISFSSFLFFLGGGREKWKRITKVVVKSQAFLLDHRIPLLLFLLLPKLVICEKTYLNNSWVLTWS